MNIKSFIYCLKYGIPYYARGFTAVQGSYNYGQSPQGIKNIIRWGNELGITVLFPVYQVRETDKELFKLRITSSPDIQPNLTIFTGYPFLRPTQGNCPLPVIYTFYKVGFASPFFGTGKLRELTRKFSEDKYNMIARNYIKEYFFEKSLDLNKSINALKLRLQQEKIINQGVFSVTNSIVNTSDNIAKRIVIDDIALSVVTIDLLLSILISFIAKNIMVGLSLFLFIWCIFIYNHMVIRTRFRGEDESFIFLQKKKLMK